MHIETAASKEEEGRKLFKSMGVEEEDKEAAENKATAEEKAADDAKTAAGATAKAAALPPGWAERTSKSFGSVYYFNATSGETRWLKPKSKMSAATTTSAAPAAAPPLPPAAAPPLPPVAAGEKPLPKGWEQKTSKSTGKVYYFNQSTGQTVWVRPEE